MLPQLNEEDKNFLRRETSHRWDQPKTLYGLVFLCSMAAAVQGMDESVINGAQLFFPQQFGISTDASIAGSSSKAQHNQWILGLVTGAPYVSYLRQIDSGEPMNYPLNSNHSHDSCVAAFLDAGLLLL